MIRSTFCRWATRVIAMCGVLAAQALAAQSVPSETTGTASASVVEPARLVAVEDLRFGAIMQPLSAGTITIGPDDSVTATGGAVVGITTPQPAEGRGAGTFVVRGEGDRMFVVLNLQKFQISNGTATMDVDKLRPNLAKGGVRRFDSDGKYFLSIGGRLSVEANQPTGRYSGTYDLTVLYN